MRILRRTGFAVTLVTGLLLTASAVNGVSGMDTTLELAASTPDRPVLVSHHDSGPGWGECDRPHSSDRDRRLT
jgi:hypothetical protein